MDVTPAAAPDDRARRDFAADETVAGPARSGEPEKRTEGVRLQRGSLVGRYVVLRELGAGGMGVVYAAQDPELDRKVALKLLHEVGEAVVSGSTTAARTRLLREAQALAKLAHPNVVAVHDVGEHEGSVWLAMEYVDGATLSAWLKEKPRSWREVLDVMAAAGRGLAAAHEAGLLHRDFKPDNVMVASEGRVRVMDFGLARLDDVPAKLEERSASFERALATPMTQTGTMMGTPRYMAPEQFQGNADARSDLFAYCVALYEGLYGQRPFRAETVVAQITAVSSGQIEPPPRGTKVPEWLRAVVVRGLSPEPDRRWPSMAALLDALANDPTQRRRRWGAAALLFGLLVGGVGSVVWATRHQAQTCRGFEDQLVGVWDEASKVKVRAAIENTGLSYAAGTSTRVEQRLDDYTAKWLTARRETCESHQRGEQSGELLDLRMRCLDERRQHVAATVAILSEATEDVVGKAVEAVAGLPSLDRCADVRALRAELPPPEDPEVARRVAALDEQLIEAAALWSTGEYQRGRELATKVVAEAQTLAHEPLHARAWLVAGGLEDKMGSHVEAEALLERAYASAVGLGMRAEAASAAAVLVYVVGCLQARHEAGRGWAKSAEPLARAAGTPEASARYLHNLGLLATAEGKYEQARVSYERALAIREATLDPDHPNIAASLNNLGVVAISEGKYERARAYYERALVIREKALGPDHPNVAETLHNLGTVAASEGKYEQARAYYERALAIWEKALGPDHPDVADTLNNLAVVAYLEGKYKRARTNSERALAIREKALGPDHPDVASSLNNLGNVATSEGKYEQARAYYERALAIWEKALGPDHPDVAVALGGLGHVATSEGKYEQARTNYDRALVIQEKALGSDHPDLAVSLVSLGDLAYVEGKYEQARTTYERALAIQEKALAPDHPDLAHALTGLGRALMSLDAPADAIPPLERALTLRTGHEAKPSELAETRFALARARWDAPADAGSDRPRARELAELAASAYDAGGDESSKDRTEVRDWLATHALANSKAP